MKSRKRLLLIFLVVLSFLLSACASVVSAGGNATNGNDDDDPNEAKVTICHKTGSATNPYVEITVSSNSKGHSKHAGDIIPAPEDGCPTTGAPTDEDDEDDAGEANTNKVTICHVTGSPDNPYVEITVSSNAKGHSKHTGDIIPAPESGCPTELITTTP